MKIVDVMHITQSAFFWGRGKYYLGRAVIAGQTSRTLKLRVLVGIKNATVRAPVNQPITGVRLAALMPKEIIRCGHLKIHPYHPTAIATHWTFDAEIRDEWPPASSY
jgi:hypothetical protein